jgi:hypothetical protein
MSRSEFVAGLYRSYLRDAERQQRIDRYREAYLRVPPGSEEDALTTESMELLGSEVE